MALSYLKKWVNLFGKYVFVDATYNENSLNKMDIYSIVILHHMRILLNVNCSVQSAKTHNLYAPSSRHRFRGR